MVSRTKEPASSVTKGPARLVPRYPLIAEKSYLPKDIF